MLDRRDFIMNMIEKMTETVGRYMLGLTQQQKHDQAIEFIEEQLTKLGVPNSRMLRSVDDDTLLSLLSNRGQPDGDKMLLVAFLLGEEALVMEDRLKQEDDRDAPLFIDTVAALRMKVLLLLLVAHEEGYQSKSIDLGAKLREVTCALTPYHLPVTLCQKLFDYYVETGQYALAENRLYDLKSAAPLSIGKQFYEKLLEKSEEELGRGDFSIAEAEDGLREWRRNSP
jgi:hypothetical protein